MDGGDVLSKASRQRRECISGPLTRKLRHAPSEPGYKPERVDEFATAHETQLSSSEKTAASLVDIAVSA